MSPSAATAEIVDALKYPTATEAPSDVLVAALANAWPRGVQGHRRQNAARSWIVLEWLEEHLPYTDHRLTDPPRRPAALKLAGAGSAHHVDLGQAQASKRCGKRGGLTGAIGDSGMVIQLTRGRVNPSRRT